MKKNKSYYTRPIFLVQTISLLLIWLLVLGIALWIANLIYLSIDLHDSFGASVGISIVAIPVFVSLAAILTYVFIGLHKEAQKLYTTNGDEK